MGKARRGSREITREQKLISENKALKRDLGRIRKELARLDLDRYDTLKEMIEENKSESEPEFGAQFLENLKKTWLCNDCRQGSCSSPSWQTRCTIADAPTKNASTVPSPRSILLKLPAS